MTDHDENGGVPRMPDRPQLKLDPSAIRAILLMLCRAVPIIVAAFGVIVSLVQTRDLAGIIAWIKSDDFVQACTAFGLIASLAFSGWSTLRRLWTTIYLAQRVKNDVAVVVKPSVPPSIETTPIPPAV